MRKFITVLATIAMVMCFSVIAFAGTKGGWNLSDGGWQYLDAYENPVYDEFRKSEGSYYYLDNDGFMAVNKVVEHDGAKYFVDETGKMILNSWIKVANEDADEDEFSWMYFGANGKAYDNGTKTINGKTYYFADAKMGYGWYAGDDLKNLSKVTDDEPWKSANYYFGGADEGAMLKSLWLSVENADGAAKWVWFKSSGKIARDERILVNGVRYEFNEDGNMVTQWGTPSVATESKYYNGDGTMVKKSWFRAKAVGAADDAEENWYYADGAGNVYADCVRKINNKWYAFDKDGVMLTGFVLLGQTDNGWHPVTSISAADMTPDFTEMATYMYFAENEDPALQGWALVGKQTIECRDYAYTFNFANNGQAVASGGKIVKSVLYYDDILKANEDADTTYMPISVDGVKYLLMTRTGKVLTKGTCYDNDNELRYKFVDGKLYVAKRDYEGKWPKDNGVEVKDYTEFNSRAYDDAQKNKIN